LWTKLHKDGIMIIHDYGSKKWIGIKPCVDEFVFKTKAHLFAYQDAYACILFLHLYK